MNQYQALIFTGRPQVIVFLFLCGFLGTAFAEQLSPQTKELVIYHTSDIHGYILPHEAKWYKDNPRRKIGGFVALAAVLAEEKSPYLLLDSGDFFQGAPEGTLSKGRSVITLMNAIGYAASAIGNHEYDFGEANLIALSKMANFPLLASNIQRLSDGAPVDYAQPWALFDKGGVKVGVVGLSTHETSTATLPAHVSHLRFVHEVEAAKPHVRALRAAGADVVIALTHCGIGPSVARRKITASSYVAPPEDEAYPGDILIAREAGVDLVLGGHAHAAFDELWAPSGGSLIAQSGEHLEHVNRIVITVPSGGGRAQFTGKLIELWADQVKKLPKLNELVKTITAEVSAKMDAKIGEALSPLNRRVARQPNQTSRVLDGPLPNLFCDEMKAVSQADFALHNTFGFRNDIGAGPINVGHIYQVMPFENTLAVMELSGAQVIQLLKQNFEGGVSRLQVSSELDLEIQEDEKGRFDLSSLKVNILKHPIDLKQKYTVAMNSYMSGGGSCCQFLSTISHKDTAIPLRVLFMETIKKKTPVKAPPTGRMRAFLKVSTGVK
jgi:2',3'-cyclic-nucleotide 2'-phosphodiesterase (5'-nucleotidase family)